ncbi:hypothetical protein EUZ85_00790 [Hahella sp. KA22]|uniref:hypothetical protein n=1 Tax=Hahella sp. KA22 TaxID=1628392 RepID=UPI000FDD1F0C|nr:hypothetical protein [Hahella sp. KA22]AZZ95033.1 hypothetical protein ENC22_29080 [Hahella sp. KA22]QAY52678.1 hypothetical protein EUZ85_00790 [Hahella sp. KA22]
MSPVQLALLGQIFAVVLCLIAALAMLGLGAERMRRQPIKIKTEEKRRRRQGGMFIIGALVWGGLAYLQTPERSNWEMAAQAEDWPSLLNMMPAAAAGIPPEFSNPSTEDNALITARVASLAEEMLLFPDNPDFVSLRNYLASELVQSEKFDRYPDPVLIDLSSRADKAAIKYIADERPGILTVIYYTSGAKDQSMLVYWPEVAGDQIIYTPISGASAKAAVILLEKELADAGAG